MVLTLNLLEHGILMTPPRRAAPTRVTSAVRAQRQQRRETNPEPLPLYESRATNSLVQPTEVSYDAPAAFSLAERIALAERARVAPSLQVAASVPHPITLAERMAEVQRSINELNRLTSAAPAAGYPLHSLQALKIVQLKQTITLMSDVQTVPAAQQGETTTRTSYEPQEPDANTLYARMLEVQGLLAEVDTILSQPASLETSGQLRTLRARIAEIMDSESAPAPSSSTAPSFPDPVHLATVQPNSISSPACEPGRSGCGEGGRARVTEDIAIPAPPEFPPPYTTVVEEAFDDRRAAGSTSIS